MVLHNLVLTDEKDVATDESQASCRGSITLGSSIHDDDHSSDEINSILECYLPYIRALTRKAIPDMLDHYDSEDLAQEVLLKLWHILKDHSIETPTAYIRRMVHNKKVELARKHKPYQFLVSDEEGEIRQGDVMVATDDEFGDPEEVFIRKEALNERLDSMLDALDTLRPRQKQAMISSLTEQANDIPQLVEALKKHQVDVVADRPENKSEMLLLKASLSPARKKVGHLMNTRRAERDGGDKAAVAQREIPPLEKNRSSGLNQWNGGLQEEEIRCRAEMEAYIGKLREPYRTAVLLHYVEKHTYSQIADELNLPLGTAKSHISRGMKMLRRLREVRSDLPEAPRQETDIAGIVIRVDKLREPYRTAVRLHCVEKHTYPQIASELNLPEGTVKSYVSRGMRMLRKSA